MGRGGFMMWWRMGRRSLGALALLFGLIAGYAPQPAEAQVTFTQITNSTVGVSALSNWKPSINADGSRIAFVSDRDLTPGSPGNADLNPEIFLWTQGAGITQITTSTGGGEGSFLLFTRPSINADGSRIAFWSDRDLTPGSPGNADGNWEIFLWTQGAGITQITNSTGGSHDRSPPSINADGTRIAFGSDRDLTGDNPNGYEEIFLWTQGAGITQITTWPSYSPSINAVGTRIAFGDSNGFLLWTQGSGITEITEPTDWGGFDFSLWTSINADGSRIAFETDVDLTGGNPDGNWEIFLATLSSAFPVLSSPLNEATGVSITPTFAWSGVTEANRYWLMVATNLADLPTDPNATTCPNCVISGSTDFTSHTLPYAFSFGRSGTLSINTTYYWKVLAWNTNGTNGNYSTTFRFTTAAPEATPPSRVEILVDDTAAPTAGDHAVIITHGLNDRATLYDDGTKSWVAEMAEDVCIKLGANPSFPVPHTTGLTKMCHVNNNNKNWDVWVYDWQDGAKGWFEPTIPFFSHNILPAILPDPAHAVVNGLALGKALAGHLKTDPSYQYQYIHFVAHSAGASLIDSATRWLKVWKPTWTIHETFLDAYDPRKEGSTYGVRADWADNYVDTRDVINPDDLDGTKLFLSNAYNIDVTTLGNAVTVSLDCLSADLLAQLTFLLALQAPLPADLLKLAQLKEYQYFCRHSRPYRFYGLSITGSFTGSFVGDVHHKLSDPIDSTAGMGFPLSVENGHTLKGDPHSLSEILRPGKKCIVQGGICYADALPLGTLHYLPTATAEVVVGGVTTAVNYVKGAGAYVFNSLKMGWSWVTSLAPHQMLAVRDSATSVATTEEPSYLVVNVTTTTPVNTLRFNWSFAAAGEGLLRVFVGGNLVSEIDQRHVTPSSPETEEIYIGGEGVPLPAGTHRITFRLDGFGTSASGVELTNVELGLVTVSSKLGVFRGGNWFLDLNGNGSWDGCGTDQCVFGWGIAGDLPVAGDWTGSGTAKLGVFRGGNWFLDLNGNGTWDGCGTDQCVFGWGIAGDLPVAGRW